MCRLSSIMLVSGVVGMAVSFAQDTTSVDGTAGSLHSPNGRIRVEFSLPGKIDTSSILLYRVHFDQSLLVDQASLGLLFASDRPWSALAMVGSERRKIDETYSVVLGKSNAARNHCNEFTCTFEETREPWRRLELVFRAYDDGIAFRYRLPEQSSLTDFTIADEATTFAFAGQPMAYALPLDSFTSSYEKYYERISVDGIHADALIGLPLLLRCPNDCWAAILEAGLSDYAGMYLSGIADRPGVLVSRLSPRSDEPAITVRGTTPHESPWRVIMVADRAGSLIESNLILNLNEPSAIPNATWITTGKTAFTWWNDFQVGHGQKGDLNTETIRHYIDFCAENNIEFYTLDGIENRAWYGGPIQPYEGADITTAVPEIDLPFVLQYARERGVGIRLWAHWRAVREHMEKAFPIYEQWGIHGVMLDFIDRDDQDAVNFYHRVMKNAADHRLTISFHGTYKPTGLRRTYPNLLTREAVMNLEYNKWDPRGSTPEHELIVPFVRMLAGPLDYHQGGFRHVTLENYQPRYTAPEIIGTRARQLAMYVVYENPLPMVADYPDAYQGQTGFDFVKEVSTTWDETRVIDGAVGDFLIVARRKGDDWYLGAMTDESARTFDIALPFLGDRPHVATTYADGPEADRNPSDVTKVRTDVSVSRTLTIRMAPAGGFAAHVRPG